MMQYGLYQASHDHRGCYNIVSNNEYLYTL